MNIKVNIEVNIDDEDISILERLVSISLNELKPHYVAVKSKAIWHPPESRCSLMKYPKSRAGLVRKLVKLRKLGYVKLIRQVDINHYPSGYWMITNEGLEALVQDGRALRKWDYGRLIELRKSKLL